MCVKAKETACLQEAPDLTASMAPMVAQDGLVRMDCRDQMDQLAPWDQAGSPAGWAPQGVQEPLDAMARPASLAPLEDLVESDNPVGGAASFSYILYICCISTYTSIISRKPPSTPNHCAATTCCQPPAHLLLLCSPYCGSTYWPTFQRHLHQSMHRCSSKSQTPENHNPLKIANPLDYLL